MGQIIITSWKRLFRNKFNMFWILLFPIALGTLFNIAFSNLGEAEMMSVIPVAVVVEDDQYGNALKETVISLSEQEDPFLEAKICSKEEALDLLENKDVSGIIYSGQNAKLTISSNMSNDQLNQSILKAFVEEFNLRTGIIIDVMKTHPEKLSEVTAAFEVNRTYNEEVSLQRNPNVDTYTQYFYNQLAMACLYAAMAGVVVAVENQGNISTLAARKTASAKKKYQLIIGELFAAVVFEFLMNIVGFLYLALVLKVGVDSQLPLAILTLFVGVMSGVSFGFCFGSFGKKDQETKNGLVFAFIMPMCFLSGLMVGNMRIIIDKNAPFINKINPAALITDSFYCLSIFEGHERYIQNMVTLVILSFLFITVGVFSTRRSKYASI